MIKITKNNYLAAFAAVVCLLALVRCIHPQIAEPAQQETASLEEGRVEEDVQAVEMDKNAEKGKNTEAGITADAEKTTETDNVTASQEKEEKPVVEKPVVPSKFMLADGSLVKHPIYSVPRYLEAFPDSQPVQERAAVRWGVSPVNNRSDAESRKKELVYMGASPYYHVDVLHRSVPYLVPRAAVLLNDIGRAYYDSLQIKGIPLHQFIVTSVLRTKEDVRKLRNYNGNATENSCHLYGTTFDICYNRYKTMQPPGEKRRMVQNDTLKWILSEVLNQMRLQGRCYIKYEVKQSCFHITTR
jgi:hypothetical protein